MEKTHRQRRGRASEEEKEEESVWDWQRRYTTANWWFDSFTLSSINLFACENPEDYISHVHKVFTWTYLVSFDSGVLGNLSKPISLREGSVVVKLQTAQFDWGDTSRGLTFKGYGVYSQWRHRVFLFGSFSFCLIYSFFCIYCFYSFFSFL